MNRAAISIPEKLFFKIGEVCDITDVQAHVLRYWESEFPMLAPQKNRAGQRTYRKRDVEMVLRIKELLYEDQYTIAGAKKKLTSELRGASKLKVVTPDMSANTPTSAAAAPPTLNVASAPAAASPETAAPLVAQPRAEFNEITSTQTSMPTDAPVSEERRAALRQLRQGLQDLLNLLDSTDTPSSDTRRK